MKEETKDRLVNIWWWLLSVACVISWIYWLAGFYGHVAR